MSLEEHPDPGMHQKVPTFRGADQATHGGLTFLELLFGLREFGNVARGILQRDELAVVWQRDRLVKGRRSRQISLHKVYSLP